MIRTVTLRSLTMLVGATLALGACSNAAGFEPGMTAALGPARAMIAQWREAGSAEVLRPTPGFPGLDPALIAGRSDPMMGAVLPSIEAVAGLVPGGESGGHAQWRTADNVAIMLTGGGIVSSTRGLGADLHASDVAQTTALVADGRAGQAERLHVYMDGAYARSELRFTCTVQPQGAETLVLNGRSRPVVRIDEACAGGGVTFTNVYWRDARGPLVRQSSQWLGPELGVIHLQRLND